MALEFQHTDRFLQEERLYEPEEAAVKRANLTQYMRSKGFSTWDELYKWSVENSDEFWGEMAGEPQWMRPWEAVREWNPPHAKWFVGAQCNIIHNALDRHMTTPVRNKVAFYWEGEDGSRRTYSYADLYRAVNRVASGLSKLGVQKGDHVIVYLPPVPEQIISMLAVARLGAIHSVVFSAFSAKALQDRVEDAQPKVVIGCDGYYYRGKWIERKTTLDEAVKDNEVVKHTVVLRRDGGGGGDIPWMAGRDVGWDDMLATADSFHPTQPMDADDALFTLYTSGTTGKPKGVVHTHGGYMVGLHATTRLVFDAQPEDVFWCTADPGWITGRSYIVYGPLLAGATSVVYEGSPPYPDPGRVWSIVEHYGVSMFYTAPTVLRGLMRHGDEWPEKFDLSTVRMLGSVGEPINPEVWVWYREKIGGGRAPIIDTWWQTETGAILVAPTPVTTLKPGSATLPFLGIEADVVDSNGDPVDSNRGGYLVIRKPWPAMMRTIFGDEERYEEYWNTIPGVYFAGDAAHKDDDGYFWIQGRVDDVISVSGHRLGSMEIESALVGHADVAEAAVIGKPHELKGESIKAFVILHAGVTGDEQLVGELRQFITTNIGPIDPHWTTDVGEPLLSLIQL